MNNAAIDSTYKILLIYIYDNAAMQILVAKEVKIDRI